MCSLKSLDKRKILIAGGPHSCISLVLIAFKTILLMINLLFNFINFSFKIEIN